MIHFLVVFLQWQSCGSLVAVVPLVFQIYAILQWQSCGSCVAVERTSYLKNYYLRFGMKCVPKRTHKLGAKRSPDSIVDLIFESVSAYIEFQSESSSSSDTMSARLPHNCHTTATAK